MARVRGVLFDFGNTLFAHAPLAQTAAQAARRHGVAVGTVWATQFAAAVERAAHAEEELRHPRDLDASVWFERWHLLYAVADDEVPGLGASVYDAMHEPSSWTPFADSIETLARLQQAGVPIVIVSNTGWDIRAVFAVYGLSSLVDRFVLSYEVGAVKPSPAIFRAACDAVGLRPSEVLMVGDDARADGGATRAGLRTLLVPTMRAGADNGIAAAADLVIGI
jgi:HAD superfamily hydrolase (TIGR01493 family)